MTADTDEGQSLLVYGRRAAMSFVAASVVTAGCLDRLGVHDRVVGDVNAIPVNTTPESARVWQHDDAEFRTLRKIENKTQLRRALERSRRRSNKFEEPTQSQFPIEDTRDYGVIQNHMNYSSERVENHDVMFIEYRNQIYAVWIRETGYR